MKVAFTGRKALGGVRMRAVSVAKRLGVPFVDLSELEGRYDCLIVVKYWDGKGGDYAKTIRKSCDRLIYDPLDVFSQKKPDADPSKFWHWTWHQLHFDDLIGTSPACVETMTGVNEIPQVECKIHLAPHHADPRIGPNWYNPNGPIVYAGGLRFIESALPQIQQACNALGRRLLVDYNKDCWRRLEGAALALHLRLPPHDTRLNKLCKPQVKLENAAAANLPCLATPHPCVMSLEKPGVNYTFRDAASNGINWKMWLDHSLKSEPLANPVTLEQHVERMREIIGL